MTTDQPDEFNWAAYGVRGSKLRAMKNMKEGNIQPVEPAKTEKKEKPKKSKKEKDPAKSDESAEVTKPKKKKKSRVIEDEEEEPVKSPKPKKKTPTKKESKQLKRKREDKKEKTEKDDEKPKKSKKTKLHPEGFKYMEKNEFVGNPKFLTDDELSICTCTFQDPCGENCVNRILCIECEQEFCPCEDKCKNRQFQNLEWVDLEVKPAGDKGLGMFTKQDVKKGQFIIEYVGEVLDDKHYQKRMMQYDGERHYYFLSLAANQTIDASRRGNNARFINHSCNPNCQLQKWIVGRENRIGIFALKDLKAGSELTFDYAMECYGLKTQKCYCGEETCRNMIVAKDSTTPKPVKTVEEKELDQARKIHRRNRSSVIALSRYLTEFKINKQIVSMADRKLFLVRNLKAVHRLRLLQYMKIEDEFEKKAQEAALETKKDEFGLYPWERRAQEQQYKKLVGHTDEEVNGKQSEKAPEKKEKAKEKKKEKKEKPKEEKKRKSVGTEPPARKRKSLPKDATKTEPKARKVEHARIAKPKKMKSAHKKEEKTPEKVSLSSEFNNNFDWEGIGVRKSKALALHSLNNNTSSATNVKKKARTSL